MAVNIPSIPEFYRGRKVFITGGSGFMGKVLIEKLLRSCPDLHTVYLLLRTKKNTQPSMRVKQITDQALFDRIRSECPEVLGKLVAVSGDVMELGLGLSDEDRRVLQDEVSVVFHSAASVRFDDPITDAVICNVRGTREVVDLALGMKNLKVMVHVSTTFCNFQMRVVEEQVYPAPGDWRTMIKIAESAGISHIAHTLTRKIIGELPNTYTYSKALGEQVINDHKHLLPLVIVRPSIVIATDEEPFPGWVDNFYGPFSVAIGAGTGIITSFYCDPDHVLDFVPVDISIKALICISVHRTCNSVVGYMPVYNCSGRTVPFTNKQMLTVSRDSVFGKVAFENMVWYPRLSTTPYWTVYFLKTVLFQLPLSAIVDRIMSLKGQRPMLMRVQRAYFIFVKTGYQFATLQKTFVNKKFIALNSKIHQSDTKAFEYIRPMRKYEDMTFLNIMGLRRHVMKSSPSTIPRCKAHMNRLYWVHQVTKTVFYLLIFWAIVACF